MGLRLGTICRQDKHNFSNVYCVFAGLDADLQNPIPGIQEANLNRTENVQYSAELALPSTAT
jgi:hypothetical protein